jgi:glycosyltransferase involved in cell wall biosynthesis
MSSLYRRMLDSGPQPRTAAAIVYEHISPHQAPALALAAETLARHGIDLVVVEERPSSRLHGWTRADAPRGEGWICLGNGREGPWTTFRRLARLVRERGIAVTIVNGWSNPVSGLMAAAAPLLGTRVVTVVDSTARDRERRPAKEAAKRLLLRRVHAVFAAGARQREYLRGLGVPDGRITVGCDVVDNRMFLDIPARPPVANRPIVIGTAARLVPEKNLGSALLALSSVARTRPSLPLEWRIVGRGPLEDELRAQAKAAPLLVRLEGFVPYGRMPEFYRGLDLYWQPSLSEPWGLAVNEAMAAGLPILASDRCGCADDLIGTENGWLHGLDPTQMAAALALAIDRRERWPAMGAASRRRIAAWDLDRFVAGLLEAIQIARDGAAGPNRARAFGQA